MSGRGCGNDRERERENVQNRSEPPPEPPTRDQQRHHSTLHHRQCPQIVDVQGWLWQLTWFLFFFLSGYQMHGLGIFDA